MSDFKELFKGGKYFDFLINIFTWLLQIIIGTSSIYNLNFIVMINNNLPCVTMEGNTVFNKIILHSPCGIVYVYLRPDP